ncbi:MAG: NUDIX hydrolase [Chloroflexota bacterium]
MAWLKWLRELQSIAQIGLAYTKDPYDAERYEQLQKLTAVISAEQTAGASDEIANLFAQEKGYATPKIDVRGAVFRDNQILLVREIADGGRWTLPGGWADVGDSPKTAVTREVYEESGFETEVVKLIAMLDRDQHPHPKMFTHTYKMFFLCQIVGGEATPSMETAEVAFFSHNEIPTDLSISRTLPQQIDLCFKHHNEPALQPVID